MPHAKPTWFRSALKSTEFKAVAIIAAILAPLTVGSYIVLRAISGSGSDSFLLDFAKGLHVEISGLLFDVILFGLLIHIVRFRDEAARTKADVIDRNMEILDDLRTWGSEEATLRVTGSLKRLTQYTTNLDLAGLCLSRVSLFERGVADISKSSFTVVGRETQLTEVSFAKVTCRSVKFSDYTPYSSIPLLGDRSASMHDSKREAILGNRRALLRNLEERGVFPEELTSMIRTILSENDALDNSTTDRLKNIVRAIEPDGSFTFQDDRENVRRALQVLTRLSEPVCFQGIDLDFRQSVLENACFDGARLVWPSVSCHFLGAQAENLSFRNATIINCDFRGFESLNSVNFDGAWFYPRLPLIGSQYGVISSNMHTAIALGSISLNGAVSIESYLQCQD